MHWSEIEGFLGSVRSSRARAGMPPSNLKPAPPATPEHKPELPLANAVQMPASAHPELAASPAQSAPFVAERATATQAWPLPISLDEVDDELDALFENYPSTSLPALLDELDSRPEIPLLDPVWNRDALLDGDAFEEEDCDTEQPDITSADRARQLARMFLLSVGEARSPLIDLVQEIILARGWSAAQVQVRALFEHGFSISSIHSAFELSDAWRDNSMLDEQIDFGTSWPLLCNPRISWSQAGTIVRYLGDEATLEELLDFVDAEHERWSGSGRFRAIFPRFKDYLFGHRLDPDALPAESVAGRLCWSASDVPPSADGVGELWGLLGDVPDEPPYKLAEAFLKCPDDPEADYIGIDHLL
ncbi:MAG: hypothetical protein RL684_2464, partial [Pseudomonadota bacterium]